MTIPLFLLSQDFFGVTVALPAIGTDLHASTATLEWTVKAFLLAFAAPLIAVGRLSDIVGRRKVALLGIAVFGAGSLICGLAPTAGWLIGGRIVQGLAAAMLFSTSWGRSATSATAPSPSTTTRSSPSDRGPSCVPRIRMRRSSATSTVSWWPASSTPTPI